VRKTQEVLKAQTELVTIIKILVTMRELLHA